MIQLNPSVQNIVLYKLTYLQKLSPRMKSILSPFLNSFLDNLSNGLSADLGEAKGHILSQNSCAP